MRSSVVAGLAILGLAAACAVTDDMPEPPEGAALFADNCASCHGDSARGGKVLASGQKPPDLTGLAARHGGVFPRARALSQIDGYGRGKLPVDAMPHFGDLLEGELVPVEVEGTLTPTPRPLVALMVYLESVQTP